MKSIVFILFKKAIDRSEVEHKSDIVRSMLSQAE